MRICDICERELVPFMGTWICPRQKNGEVVFYEGEPEVLCEWLKPGDEL